jgi:hypothetical protein
MAQSTYVGFPNMQNAVNATLGAASAAITRGVIKRGTTYRVTSTVDCWLQYEAAAVVGEGMYLPAKTPAFFCFGSRDPQGTDVQINHIAGGAGTINFVPILPVF